jgi:spermidine synthase
MSGRQPAHLRAGGALPARQPAWVPQATVFVSSFCIMVLELVAGRIVSRHLGSSLYTWTSVIGVVLAGIALGNWLGGRLADRRPARPTLSLLFLVAAGTCVLVLVANHLVGRWTLLWSFPWPLRVGSHVAIVFLVPSVILGMISPVAAKMALDQGRETGRTIGGVYAWGVVGSIAGTFATGFWLIAAFGTATVVWAVAGVLAVMGVVFAAGSRTSWFGAGLVALATILGAGPWAWAASLGTSLALREEPAEDLLFSRESQYSHVRVHQVSKDPDVRNMHLDKLLHSTIVMERPGDLQYPYERVYAAVTRQLVAGRDSLNTLTIGGGGYVFPRWLEQHWPRSRTEVVEIDPVVTEAAIAAFGLPADHDLVVAHEDGRAYLGERVRRAKRESPFDLVYLDVFDDYSVPYQLTTVECLREVDASLAPDGAFLMNLIDIYSEGGFLGAMLVTMEDVFPRVAVFTEGSSVAREPDARRTFILVGWKGEDDLAGIERAYGPSIPLYRLSAADLADLRARKGRVLTDDWAPVENLLAPVVMRSSREISAGLYVARAREAFQHDDLERALRNAEKAIGLSPDNVRAREIAAYLSMQRGDTAKAIEHFRAILAVRPQEIRARIDLATALARSGRPAEGRAQLEEAVRLDPANPVAWSNLGHLRRATGDAAGAEEAARRAAELERPAGR